MYLLFRHNTNSLPPRDVIVQVLKLRIKTVFLVTSNYTLFYLSTYPPAPARLCNYVEKDEHKHGLEQRWYDDGQKEFEITWKHGKKNGVETVWFENGQKWIERTWKDGKQDGAEWWWYDDGQKQMEITWKDDEQYGLGQCWKQNN